MKVARTTADRGSFSFDKNRGPQPVCIYCARMLGRINSARSPTL